jgi:hypothetical protein
MIIQFSSLVSIPTCDFIIPKPIAGDKYGYKNTFSYDDDDANNNDNRNIRNDLSSIIRKMYLLTYSVQQCPS